MDFLIRSTTSRDRFDFYERYGERINRAGFALSANDEAPFQFASIKLESFEDMLKLYETVKHNLIFGRYLVSLDLRLPTIEIYDNWRE